MKKKLIGLAGILISVAIIYYITQNVNIKATEDHISKVKYWQLITLMSIYLLSFIPRAYRWQLMLMNYPTIKFQVFLKAIIVGFAGNNFIPARGGELLRMEFFSRNTKIPRITALTSVFTEKILDGLVLLGILIIGVFLSPSNIMDSIWLKNLLAAASFLFIGALLFIGFIKYNATQIETWLNSQQKSLLKKIYALFKKINDAIQFLKFDLNTLKIFAISFLIWLIEALVFILCIYFLSIETDVISAGCIVLAVVNFGILIPSSPAYLGVFQAMAMLSLSLFGIEESVSLTLGVVVHFSQFILVTIIGIVLAYQYIKDIASS